MKNMHSTKKWGKNPETSRDKLRSQIDRSLFMRMLPKFAIPIWCLSLFAGEVVHPILQWGTEAACRARFPSAQCPRKGVSLRSLQETMWFLRSRQREVVMTCLSALSQTRVISASGGKSTVWDRWSDSKSYLPIPKLLLRHQDGCEENWWYHIPASMRSTKMLQPRWMLDNKLQLQPKKIVERQVALTLPLMASQQSLIVLCVWGGRQIESGRQWPSTSYLGMKIQ